MTKDIIILGSTGSIGTTTLSCLKLDKNFKIRLLTTNSNLKKILKQAIKFKVKNVIVEDKKKFKQYKTIFKKKKIRLFLGSKNINKVIKKKVDYCVSAISGIEGLYPTLQMIPLTKKILIANKESIICGWDFISKKLKQNNTEFIPIDSEHFSIWKLLKNENMSDIDKIILTASGGPFLNKKKKLSTIKLEDALNHPNWKMGKKISIDSSTMMNKIYEFIEAKKIFNLSKDKLSILIHPKSFVHAIIYFKGNLIKFLAHDTSMSIPISNALDIKNYTNFNLIKSNLLKSNSLFFQLPKIKEFPLLSILKIIPDRTSYFETILITLNDTLVNKFLDGEINYISIQLNLLNLIKKPYFTKFYKLKPKSIYDIKKMIIRTNIYLDENLKYYEK